MEKPTDCPLSTDGTFDYDLSERVVRQLQESHLHVYAACVFSSLPDALKTGSPNDELTSIMVSLTMITDGTRGFLILVDEATEWDATYELTELLREIVPREAGPFVVRAASMDPPGPRTWPGTLRFEDPERVSAEVERAYEDAFLDGRPADHAAFLGSFAPYGYWIRDERAIREEMREHDSAMQRVAAPRSVGTAMNRAERRWQARRERRSARKRRARAK